MSPRKLNVNANPETAQRLHPETVELPPELEALEAALRKLAPRHAAWDRDRLLFDAGRQAAMQASAPPVHRRWIWPALAGAMTALAASLLVILVLRPEPSGRERIVFVPVESPSRSAANPTERPELRSTPSAVDDEDGMPTVLTHPSCVSHYVRFRDHLLGRAPELRLPQGVPSAPNPSSAPATYADLRFEWLGTGDTAVPPYL